MDQVGALLAVYGLPDPVVDDTTGAFTSEEMGALYGALVAQGIQSEAAALAVGAAIEELDIADLAEALAELPPSDVTTVFENLMKGSRNHLRAFVGQLDANSYPYEPTSLTDEEVDAILSTPAENGPVGGAGQGGGKGLDASGNGSTDEAQGGGGVHGTGAGSCDGTGPV